MFNQSAELKRMKKRFKVIMNKANNKNQSFIDNLPADTVFKVLAKHNKESNENDMLNSICEETAFEQKSMIDSKLKFSIKQVDVNLNNYMTSSIAS